MSANEEMQIITQEAEVKYFHMMLNMAEDELDQPEYRLLGHYVRWAGHGGMEQEGIRQTATRCHMGTDMVEKTRKVLVAKGYLRVIKPSDEERKNGVATRVIVVDRWMENTLYCQNKYKVSPIEDTSTPVSLPQTEGGVPDQVDSEYSQTPCKEMSTSLVGATHTTQTADGNSDDATKVIDMAIAPVCAKTTQPQLPLNLAPEPNLPKSSPYKAIVVPVAAEGGVVVEEAPKKKKVQRQRKVDLEMQAVIKAFGLIPGAYAKNTLYKSLIFGSTKEQKGVWADAQLQPPSTIDELERYVDFAEKKAGELECCTPTAPATIQAWFEEFRQEQIAKQKQREKAERLKQAEVPVVPIGIRRIIEKGLAAEYGINPAEYGYTS